MVSLLINTVDQLGMHTPKRGDVIAALEDGQEFGTSELENVEWVVECRQSVSMDAVAHLLSPGRPRSQHSPAAYRTIYIDLDNESNESVRPQPVGEYEGWR